MPAPTRPTQDAIIDPVWGQWVHDHVDGVSANPLGGAVLLYDVNSTPAESGDVTAAYQLRTANIQVRTGHLYAVTGYATLIGRVAGTPLGGYTRLTIGGGILAQAVTYLPAVNAGVTSVLQYTYKATTTGAVPFLFELLKTSWSAQAIRLIVAAGSPVGMIVTDLGPV